MKEEQIKRILKKSELHTSDDFVDRLVKTLAEREALDIAYYAKLYQRALLFGGILFIVATFFVFKTLNLQLGQLGTTIGQFKTPIFALVSVGLLYGLNSVVRLNRSLLLLASPES